MRPMSLVRLAALLARFHAEQTAAQVQFVPLDYR